MKENKQINIGCVGMTHLGLVHAAAFAEKGFNVICYDEQLKLIEQLKRHQLPVNEPELDFLVQKNSTAIHLPEPSIRHPEPSIRHPEPSIRHPERSEGPQDSNCQQSLTFTHDLYQLNQCAVVFIAYDVPTDDEGNSNLNVIHQLLEKIGPALSQKASLVLLSQVPPGFTRGINFPKERLFYQVETLIFGKAVERALYPERYIVGAYQPHHALPHAYEQLLKSFNCPILKMKYESAELAKISINMFLVASVATTNTLAEICENIGADWDDIAPTLRLDKRIGQHAYLTPGLGIAGGNLERDLNTIIKIGQQHETDTGVVHAWLKNSKHRRDWVLRCLQNEVLPQIQNPKICILGLAYKPNTHSIKNSPSIALIRQLKDYDIHAHDPIVKGAGLTHAKQHSDMFQALHQADVVILMLPSTEYQQLSLEQIAKMMRGNVIIDPYHVLQNSSLLPMHGEKVPEGRMRDSVHYFSLGVTAHTLPTSRGLTAGSMISARALDLAAEPRGL